MSKILLALLATFMTYPVLAWDDSHKDPSRYLNDNTPKSYTLSGDTYRSRRESPEESYSKPYGHSQDNSRGTLGGYETRHNGSIQINNNGLIINRE